MTALCIIGGVLLFFVWLFTRKLHIGAGFADDPFLYVRILFLKLRLPPEKAAHTAAQLWMLVCSLKRRTRNPKLIYTEIKPDFIAEQTDFYADIELSIRLWQILSLGMTALGVYKKLKSDSEVKK